VAVFEGTATATPVTHNNRRVAVVAVELIENTVTLHTNVVGG
jgi:hypothetical protein